MTSLRDWRSAGNESVFHATDAARSHRGGSSTFAWLSANSDDVATIPSAAKAAMIYGSLRTA